MYRVQLFVKVPDARENAILGSWTCPNKEAADKKVDSLKKTYGRDTDYTIKKFSLE